MKQKVPLGKTQRIKSVAYRGFYRLVVPLLGHSLFAIRVKWFVALKLVGLEFHLENISRNQDKLLRYTDPRCPLTKQIAEVVAEFSEVNISMLDVGCGPFSKTGNCMAGKVIVKELLDPLAREYQALYDRLQLPNKPRIKLGFVEKLDEHFPTDCFHVIHARNCIDHCFDPILAVEKMVKALKPGGCIVMQHFINEGENAGYYGLHQWNFNLVNESLFIRNKDSSIVVNLSDEHRETCRIKSRCADGKLSCELWKHPAVSNPK